MNEDQWRQGVEATRKGDKKAFEQLYRETERAVYFTCLKIVANEDTARDMMQEAFMTALQRLETLDDGAKFPMWINRIAVNKCMHSFRQKPVDSLEEQTEQGFDPKDDESFIPEEYVTDEAKRKIIMDIIDRVLTDVQRQAVIMYYYDDMSLEEIATVTGDKVKTISARLCSAREKIKEAVLIYEKQHDDRLHALVPVPILTQILRKEAAAIGVPDILPTLLGSQVFNAMASASANTLTNGVIAGGSKMTNFITAKVIAIIAAGVIAAGGITAAVLSKNSDKDKDTSSKSSSVSASSDKDSKSGADSDNGESGSDDGSGSSDSAENESQTSTEFEPANGSVYTYRDVNFILPPRYDEFSDNSTETIDFCDKATFANAHYGVIQMAIATSDSYKSFSTQEVKEYFDDQSTYYDLLDQIHGFFWVDDTTVDSSDTVQIKGKDFIRETGTYKVTCDKDLKYDVPYIVYYGKVDLGTNNDENDCPMILLAYSTDSDPGKKQELETSLDNMVKGIEMDTAEAEAFAATLTDDYMTYTHKEPTFEGQNGTKGSITKMGRMNLLLPQNWYIFSYGTGNDDMDNAEFYSPDGKQRLKFRKADKLNATRWLDDVIEREKDDPDLTMEDIPEFTLNNFKWHGVRLKGQEISEQYVIIGEDLSTPGRWIYLYGMGTTCDSDLSVDVINSLEVFDSVEHS